MTELSPVGQYIDELLACPKLGPQICHHQVLPEAAALFAENRRPWPGAIGKLLSERDIRLYSHQALATDHIRAGHSIVAATPTASGKSLIYNLPVLERHLLDPEARALYLFPLKALAQDQLQSFNALCTSWPEEARPTAALYDGDTSDYMRRKIRRDPPTTLITNPEMLNLAILPHHEQWAPFLAGLAHIVVDEAHIYRGVFGSHLCGLFRRLNRICARYGANPAYVFCTATLGNPGELCANLIGTNPGNVHVIDKSGAPQGARHFLFLNPDLSPATAAIDLLKRALAQNLRTIVYCKSRRMTELVSLWAGAEPGPWKNRISAYRAGFLAEERRDIEARMASGDLLAVVSTSALELGIDIGGLDLCILVGYPGSVTQTMQRGGRVGRGKQESAVVLVAGEDALDQYFARHPEDFFSRPPEKAVVNPDNEVILERHLVCAGAEMPLALDEPWLERPAARKALARLVAKGLLLPTTDGLEYLAARKKPQRDLDLRGAGQSFGIEDGNGAIIGMIDGLRAFRETHEGAVYLHRGRSYVVEELAPARRRILVKPAKTSYFTRARSQKSTDILEEFGRRPAGRSLCGLGRLRITERISGYEKRANSGNRLLTIVPLRSPPQVFETEGLWFVIPEKARARLEEEFIHFMGSIHALEHAMIGALPLMVMADRNDFGGISIPLHPQIGQAAIFVYDGLPGGAGLARAAFPDALDLLRTTRKMIADCPCEDGCPSCVHSPKCGSGNRPITKQGALALLDELLAEGNDGEELAEKLVISPAPDRLAPSPGTTAAADITVGRQIAENPAASACGLLSPPNAVQLSPAPLANYASIPPPGRFVVFDVETRRSAGEVGGWGKADKMGVSIAVAYDSADDAFHAYQQDELAGLFERMCAANLVIGFNSLRFDYTVLWPFAANYPKMAKRQNLRFLPSLDLLERVHRSLGYRVSLDNLARATLNAPKNANGLQALAWWKEGRLDEIEKYCRKDVELTRDLYLRGLKDGFLLFTSKAGQKARVPVDFKP